MYARLPVSYGWSRPFDRQPHRLSQTQFVPVALRCRTSFQNLLTLNIAQLGVIFTLDQPPRGVRFDGTLARSLIVFALCHPSGRIGLNYLRRVI